MKIIKLTVILITALALVVGIGGWVLLKTFDVNKLLPQITREASKAIGRELHIGRAALDFSLKQGCLIKLSDMTLADAPGFSDGPFLKAPQAEVGIDIGAFIFQHKLQVLRVAIVSPEVVVIRSKEGVINALTITALSSEAPAPSVASATGQDNGALAWPALIVNDISITDARVIYIDEMFSPRLMLTIQHIDIHVADFSLTDLFAVKVRASLVSSDQDMKAVLKISLVSPQAVLSSLNGTVQVDAKDGLLEHVNILALALGHIPMLPGLLETIMPELSPETQQEVKEGITRLESLKADARIVNGVLEIDTADLVTRDVDVHAQGWVKLVEDMDVKTDVRIAPELSTRLAQRVNELSFLKDGSGRIHVPIGLKGPVMKPRVMPDSEYLSKKLIMAIGGEKLQKVLGGNGQAAQAVDAIFDMFRKK